MIIMFGRKNCMDCIVKKKEFERDGIEFIYHDIDTADGLAEAAFRGLTNGPKKLPIIIEED